MSPNINRSSAKKDKQKIRFKKLNRSVYYLYYPAEMQGQHYVDMESRGVALVAEQFRKPCTILRVPIDEIGSVSCETFDRVGAIEEMREKLKGQAKRSTRRVKS